MEWLWRWVRNLSPTVNGTGALYVSYAPLQINILLFAFSFSPLKQCHNSHFGSLWEYHFNTTTKIIKQLSLLNYIILIHWMTQPTCRPVYDPSIVAMQCGEPNFKAGIGYTVGRQMCWDRDAEMLFSVKFLSRLWWKFDTKHDNCQSICEHRTANMNIERSKFVDEIIVNIEEQAWTLELWILLMRSWWTSNLKHEHFFGRDHGEHQWPGPVPSNCPACPNNQPTGEEEISDKKGQR